MGGNSANGGVTSKIFPLFSNTRGSYAFECATCHSVHDDQHTMFLRTTIDGSKLCLGCHIK